MRSRSGGTGSFGAASMVRIRSVAVSDRSISGLVTASRPLRTCSNAASTSCANDEIASKPNIPLEPFTVWIARKMRSTSSLSLGSRLELQQRLLDLVESIGGLLAKGGDDLLETFHRQRLTR